MYIRLQRNTIRSMFFFDLPQGIYVAIFLLWTVRVLSLCFTHIRSRAICLSLSYVMDLPVLASLLEFAHGFSNTCRVADKRSRLGISTFPKNYCILRTINLLLWTAVSWVVSSRCVVFCLVVSYMALALLSSSLESVNKFSVHWRTLYETFWLLRARVGVLYKKLTNVSYCVIN